MVQDIRKGNNFTGGGEGEVSSGTSAVQSGSVGQDLQWRNLHFLGLLQGYYISRTTQIIYLVSNVNLFLNSNYLQLTLKKKD